jgi:hypothetical protein
MTLKTIRNKHIVNVAGKESTFDTLSEALTYIGGLYNASKI